MDIDIKINAKALEKVLDSLKPENVEKVIRKGLTVAGRNAGKASVKAITKHYQLKQKDAKVNVRVRVPRGNRTESSVTIQAQPLGLDLFKPSKRKGGISVRVYRGKGADVIPSAFIAKRHKGKPSVFVRTRAIKEVARKYVLFPAKAPTHRTKKGSELPINRLLADPASEVVAPIANAIAAQAANDAAVQMLVSTENILDNGKL